MEFLVTLLVLFLVLVLVVFPVWALIKIVSLGRQNDAIADELRTLRHELHARRDPPASATRPLQPEPLVAPPAPSLAAELPRAAVATLPPPPETTTRATPPTLPPFAAAPTPLPSAFTPASLNPPPPPIPPKPPVPFAPFPPAASPSRAPRINWEHFTGAKLFSWIGGLAAFLGAAFFVKYSFDHDLIPPEVRVALGFLFAIGLVIGGLKINRARYGILAQTLCATGIVILYAVTFACNSIYHFAFFGLIATFLLMGLVTATAFLLAIRLEARVVAILGILGGFLTPVLLSTGHDNPPGLFGYLGLLNIGLIAVALHRRWNFLVPLGAGGTVAMQIGWASKFLGHHNTTTAMVVAVSFCALFLAAYLAARRFGRITGAPPVGSPHDAPDAHATEHTAPPHFLWSALAFPFVAFAFALLLFETLPLATHHGLLLTFVLLADLCLLAVAWLDARVPQLHLIAGVAVF
ncbi:MAG: DUF2339 domain-containing protein, partial [Opitutaceae bacterium]